MKQKLVSLTLTLCLLLGLVGVTAPAASAATYDWMDSAEEVTLGEEITIEDTDGYNNYYYKLTSSSDGASLTLENSSESPDYFCFYIYDDNGNYEGDCDVSPGCTNSIYLSEAGTYYIRIRIYDAGTYTFTATLKDPTSLTSGESVSFTIGSGDANNFSVTTTKAGQDIALSFSGFSSKNRTYAYLHYGEYAVTLYTNETVYLHATEAGTHTFYLTDYEDEVNTYSVTAQLLDGDENEANDTEATATALNYSEDAYFSIGGYGDEDWFSFEAESGEKYTLWFYDLATDYSDAFYYSVYAPDGTELVSDTEVNIRHSNTIACDQTGQYFVKVFSSTGQSIDASNDSLSRSTLRIRVEAGSSDPYEPNDDWTDAAQVETDTEIPYVLSTTTDEDWFCLEVPEENMTLTITLDSAAQIYLYDVATLQKYGAVINSNYYLADLSSNAADTYCYKFTNAGTYYFNLSAYGSSYVSSNLRTMTLSLAAANDVESNDTWKTATQIYSGVPQSFDLTAYNDYDWFKITVPEDVEGLRISAELNKYSCIAVYKKSDFESIGDEANPVSYGYSESSYSTVLTIEEPDIYFLKCYCWDDDYISEGNTLTCELLYDYEAHDTIATAIEGAEGEWISGDGESYISLGECTEGQIIRFSLDGYEQSIYVRLRNSKDTWVDTDTCALGSVDIPSDGEYYLQVVSSDSSSLREWRLRYDIGEDGVEPTDVEGEDTVTLAVGESQFLDLRVTPYHANVNGCHSWSAPDSSVAEFDYETGYVTGVAVGETEMSIDFYGDDGSVTKTITINVVETTATTSLSITGAPEELAKGSSVTLGVSRNEDATDTVTWSSSDTSVLYVSAGGVVTAVGEGEATITATAGDCSDSVTITATAEEVSGSSNVTGVRLDRYTMTMYVDEEDQQLTASVLPEGIEDVTVTWSSSNTAVAGVDAEGLVKAYSAGVSVITAKAGDYTASCVVTVQAARTRVESIAFDTDETELQVLLGAKTTLSVVFTPSDATTQTLTWSSSDEEIATVSRTGIVTALKVGETIITAASTDGNHTASITICVTATAQMGDINGDGYIDSADAYLTLRSVVGLTTLTEAQEEVADVNGDGYVDAGDAIRILRYAAGLITSVTLS